MTESEPEKQNRRPVEAPRNEAKTERMRPEMERRRRALERRLLELMLPPTSPLRRVIWSLALASARMEIAAEIRAKDQETRPISQKESQVSRRAHGIVEAVFTLISREVLLPLLRIVVADRYRVELDEHQEEYSRLVELYVEQEDPELEAFAGEPEGEMSQ